MLPNDLISTIAAAKLLTVTPQAVRLWIRQGRLCGYRVGSLWKVSQRAVEAFAKPSVAGGTDAARAIASTEQHRRDTARLAAMGLT